MTTTEWAEKEIDLAIMHENPDWAEGMLDYGISCYLSALKAYKALMNGGHSGTSFGITKNILIRLMNGLPLMPITDDDFIEDENTVRESELYLKKHDLKSSIQCHRMFSLFKKTYLDGKVVYTDIDRCKCIDIHSKISYTNGQATSIVNELFPITMPYKPTVEKYRMYCEDFLTDEKNGDFDTKGFFYLIKPDGKKVEINRFFAEINGKWKQISKEEYKNRKVIKIHKFCDE